MREKIFGLGGEQFVELTLRQCASGCGFDEKISESSIETFSAFEEEVFDRFLYPIDDAEPAENGGREGGEKIPVVARVGEELFRSGNLLEVVSCAGPRSFRRI